jgi:hypothetical protein
MILKKPIKIWKMNEVFVEHWTHSVNERGKVEIRCIMKDREFFIELEDKDVERIYSWLLLKRRG